MRQLTIVFLIVLSSYCSLATARCITKQEASAFYHFQELTKSMQQDNQRASPGSTASEAAQDQLMKVMTDYNARRYGATIDGIDTSSDSLKKIGKVFSRCLSSKIVEVTPEMAKIWNDCDEKTNYQFEMRRNCVNDEIRKICPSLVANRNKRSPVPDLDVLFWSAGQ